MICLWEGNVRTVEELLTAGTNKDLSVVEMSMDYGETSVHCAKLVQKIEGDRSSSRVL